MVVDGGGGWLAERERESFTPVLERERQRRRKKTGERELKPGKMKKICSKFSKQNKVTLQL